MSEEHRNCPNCGHRLPRRNHFVGPSGETLRDVLLTIAAFAGVAQGFALALTAPLNKAVIGGVALGAWDALLALMVAAGASWLRQEPPVEDDEPPAAGATIGGDVRRVGYDGQIRYLRENGFVVPPEPERGALSKWLWAVKDDKVTFSVRGANAALRDTPDIRTWSKKVLALWCKAGWATPRSGWNGDEPDLSQGVHEVDESMIARCANEGQRGLIHALIDWVERDIEEREQRETEPPYFGGNGEPRT